MADPTITVVDDLSKVPAAAWDARVAHNPTLRHAWLQSMIDAGCTTVATGWLPQFMLLWRGAGETRRLAGAIPLYLKSHSYGEYIFDWAWAEAYARAGLDYYPKLVAAVPFTPCGGQRVAAETDEDRATLIAALLALGKNRQVSSIHVLFPRPAEQSALMAAGFMPRTSVQFHWRNPGYKCFDDLLATLNHDKRKKLKQERRKVAEAGISFVHKVGAEISMQDWDFFASCYARTYRQHRSTPYLNRVFFGLISKRMPENLLLILALRDGQPIATALNLFDANTLYGRYWGSSEFYSGLHFETCYYQAMEFCIARGIQLFEGGAQGEHKLARGFLPVTCHSAHWLIDPRFARAVEDFLTRERSGVAAYVDELHKHGPYRATPA